MTTTTKPFDEIVPGDFIHDMHDGIGLLRKRFGVVSRIEGDGNWFPQLPNKHLVVLGLTFGGLDTQFPDMQIPHIGLVCGYQYDGRRSGILVLVEYVKGPDPRD